MEAPMIRKSNKVTVLGASGAVGQSLALLLKSNPLISKLSLYDIKKNTPGVGLDLSHINNCCIVEGFHAQQIDCALVDSNVVIIAAGNTKKSGMNPLDIFNCNAEIVYKLTVDIGTYAPCAFIVITSNPINSSVPIVSMAMAKTGYYNPAKIFGVTTLNLIRAATFVGKACNVNPAHLYVPVIGGNTGNTIVPLISQCVPSIEATTDQVMELTTKIREAGTLVKKAKIGVSATLSTAFATARFVSSLLKGLSGEPGIVECAYVKSNITDCDYFSTPVLLGRNGMKKNLGYGYPSTYEQSLIGNAIPILKKDITAGMKFVSKKLSEYEEPKTF